MATGISSFENMLWRG